MGKSERLKRLLAAGYFPSELPPPFHTNDIAKYRQVIGKAWPSNSDYKKSAPETFSSPRVGIWRRDLSIVNPVAQYYLSRLIAEEWVAIRKYLRPKNLNAQDVDIADNDIRSVAIPDWELITLREQEISAEYDHILVADISRFYGTLYTHAIPWAMHTKAYCKKHLNNKSIYDKLLGTRIDVAVRKGNENQTAGIPIGPDTSRIISEIVASEIDRSLAKALGLSRERAVRNVDDWFIGFDTLGQAQDAIHSLTAACRPMELEVHPEKTRVNQTNTNIEPVWPAHLRSILVGITGNQAKQMQHFFAQALDLASKHTNANVLGYAIKLSRGWKVKDSNWHFYENFILRCARTNKTTLPVVAQIFVSYQLRGHPLTAKRALKLCNDLIRDNVASGGHFEVAWALFIAMSLGLRLKASQLADVVKLESSVCALLCLDLKARGLIDGKLNESYWKRSMTATGLYSNMWLLAYEAHVKGWLPASDPNFVKSDPHFGELLKHRISFYGSTRSIKVIGAGKPRARTRDLKTHLDEIQNRSRGLHGSAPDFFDDDDDTYGFGADYDNPDTRYY